MLKEKTTSKCSACNALKRESISTIGYLIFLSNEIAKKETINMTCCFNCFDILRLEWNNDPKIRCLTFKETNQGLSDIIERIDKMKAFM